ncbi:MAG: ABC transporter permease [Trueperaceae bacterium]
MLTFILRRLGLAALSIVGIMVIVFLALHAIPGDVALILLDQEVTPELLAQLRNDLGLDRPLHVQFISWAAAALRGDLGESFRTGSDVTAQLVRRYGITIQLAAMASVLSVVIGVPTGIISAIKRGSTFDYASRTVALLGISIPNFWLGILLILLFSLQLRLLPTGGYVPPGESLMLNMQRMLMPSLTLGAAMAAVVMRMTRSALLETLAQDYTRTARAKGLAERYVIGVHALRNALIPVITIVGLQLGHILGGTVVVEEVFSLPGVGRLVVRAIYQRDYPVVQGGVLVLAASYVLINLLVDLLYSVIDPRIKYD